MIEIQEKIVRTLYIKALRPSLNTQETSGLKWS